MAKRASAGQVRIIGGEWRGRRLPVPEAPGLRPTGDRVRETLFNWLRADIAGRRVLDLFAGSGALGFEAASLGAAEVWMVEANPRVARHLRETAAMLGADRVHIENRDALQWLAGQKARYDVVFLDPPFDAGLLTQVIDSLLDRGIIAPAGRIYYEYDARGAAPAFDRRLRVLRHKRAGQVAFGVLEPVAGSG